MKHMSWYGQGRRVKDLNEDLSLSFVSSGPGKMRLYITFDSRSRRTEKCILVSVSLISTSNMKHSQVAAYRRNPLATCLDIYFLRFGNMHVFRHAYFQSFSLIFVFGNEFPYRRGLHAKEFAGETCIMKVEMPD